MVREKGLEPSRLWLDTGTSSLPVYLFQHSRVLGAKVIITETGDLSTNILPYPPALVIPARLWYSVGESKERRDRHELKRKAL